ncbi:hypothetical protein [Pseudomonas phage PPAY]|nr:hypothetical protein [Pseudomonas phage PPAY]
MVVDGIQVLQASVAPQAFLFADDQSAATLVSDYLICDNAYGPAGTYLIYPNSDITSIPTRQMRQTGSVDITTTASSLAIAPAQSYRYPYSKIPVAHVCVSSQNGGDQGTIGSVVPVPVAYNIQTTTIRPGVIASSGAFVAGGTAKLHWTTGISDI